MVFRCGTSKNTGFEKCCDSKFFMNGQVLNGPATFGLKQYQVIKTGTELSIKN
jgi:Rieske Fe-S protein